MKRRFSVGAGALSAAVVALSLVTVSPARSATVTVDLSTAVLTGGASFIAGGSRISFAPNATGTATVSFPSIPGEPSSIDVTGQTNSSTSFFDFAIDKGNGVFVSLASGINFGSGFNTITLPSFIDVGTTDRLQISNSGTGNIGGQIAGLGVTLVPLPPAIALFATGLGGMFLVGRRRKRKVIATAARAYPWEGSMSTTKSAGLAICMFGLAVTQAQAETINVTITQDSQTTTAPALSAASTAVLVDTTALNAALAANGSAYRFLFLFGSSNFPGTPLVGTLDLIGTIFTTATGSTSPLTITETESGFTQPISGGLPGTLTSAATAIFSGAASGDHQVSHSSVNSTLTPALTLTSTGPALNSADGLSATFVASLSTPYSLTNEISFSLSPGAISDQFSVKAEVDVIPLPPAIYLFGSVLAGAFWLGRRNPQRR